MSMEDVLDGVKNYFDSNLGNALTAIESARSVTIPRWLEMDTADIRSRQYPMIEILADNKEPDYGEEKDYDWWNYYYITIWVTNSGGDPKTVLYALLRYEEAFEDLVKTDSTFGDIFNRIRLGGSDFSPAVEAQKEGKILQVLTQDLEIRNLA